ncbi:class I SAM-dependent methyltransferase [Candidatus Poribacteria bacterium]|nr:class I SAM-dependent methyltransferase [Candidatus Poribacteria bacterium]
MNPVVNCPVCSSAIPLSKAVPKRNGYWVCLCLTCRLKFAHPMRAASEDLYEQAQLPGYKVRRLGSYMPKNKKQLKNLWTYQQFAPLSLPKGSRVLDIGCGAGEFLAACQMEGYQATGVDFDRKAIEIARSVYGLNVQCQSIEEFLLNNDQMFGAITMFDVLEHVEAPVTTLSMLQSKLAPTGYLIVRVPSWKRWPPLFAPGVDEPPHHLTLWSFCSLKQAFEQAGLVVNRITRLPLTGEEFLSLLAWRIEWLMRPGRLQWVVRGVLRRTFRLSAHIAAVYPNAGGYALLGIAQRRP